MKMQPDACFGWTPKSLWCLLDRICGCRWRRVCDAHDDAIWRHVDTEMRTVDPEWDK